MSLIPVQKPHEARQYQPARAFVTSSNFPQVYVQDVAATGATASHAVKVVIMPTVLSCDKEWVSPAGSDLASIG